MRAESLKRWAACLAGGMSITWILRVLWVRYGQHITVSDPFSEQERTA